jgi:hypothetical protein
MATPVQPIPVLVNRARNGKLNSDTDILEIKEGNYPDRVNVEFNADAELFSDTPALGNRLVCDIGIQQVQQQQTRIYIDNLFETIVIQFYNKNGQLIGEYEGSAESQSIQGMKDAIVSALSGITSDFTYSLSFDNDNNSEPFIDVTINCAYSDYTLILKNNNGDNNGNILRNDDIKEAISITGQGGFIEIGSKDLLGTTWLFSTTQDNEQTSIYDASMSMYLHNQYGGQIAIYFPNHGLIFGESIVVANAVGTGAIANGEWVVNIIDDNNFALFLSIPTGIVLAPALYGGIIYKNTFGVGQIGVQQYVGETDSYTYTRILASKRLNFRTMYQIDVDAVLNNNGYLLKFTDNYNYPRTFSYRGEFIEDGALQPINPDGFYTYETLTDEIKNIINYSAAVVEYEEQAQVGGSVPPANWRYAVEFLTDTNSTTELSLISNPIPTFAPAYIGYTTAYQPIYGNAIGNNLTPKINRVRVTGITPGIFKYIQLVGFNYASSSVNTVVVNAFRIRKELLTPEQTEVILEHNGNEPDITFFDTTLAIAVRPDIIRVGSNRFCENRLVYGNITTSTEIDIRDWALTMKYSIKRKSLFAAFRTEMWEEFYNPENTPKYTGYQPYEWYRFYISAETYSGKITDSVFCFDMRFLSQADYASYGQAEFNDINGGDRREIAGDEYYSYAPGDWQALPASSRTLYQMHIELNNIDWDYQINGVKVKDIFKSIKISRAERVQEVIATGVFVGRRIHQYTSGGQVFPGGGGAVVGGSPAILFYDSTGSIFPGDFMNIGSFYSPDILFGFTQYNGFQPGDQLINFGYLPSYSSNTYFDPSTFVASTWQTIGPNLAAYQPPQSAQIVNIVDCKYIGAANSADFVVAGVTRTYYKSVKSGNQGEVTGSTFVGSPVIQLDQGLQTNGQPNSGMTGKYQTLIFRKKKDKYGARDAFGNTIVFTGVTAYNGQSSVSVFGGDVFNQQVQFRQLIRISPDTSSYAFNIISTNIVNANLRQFDPNAPFRTFPVFPSLPDTWMIPAIGTDSTDVLSRNTGYNIFNQVQASTVFDPEGNDSGNYITRKYYSQLNPNNANTDKYREFMPVDFQDNPNSYGPITHLEVVNGELFTLQQRGFTREFFNATGRLQSAEDGDLLIGDGSVLSRKGLRLTMLGTNQKWSVCKGFTSSGKECIIWVNDEFGCVIRFGADGTVNISEREMMSTFFRERMRFVIGKDTPANNQGITTVWDNIGKNFIITQRAWKDSPEWMRDIQYYVGDTVIRDQNNYGISQIFICIAENISGPFNTPGGQGGTVYWDIIPMDNQDYYNVYTIVFNEQKNSFTHRYTFYPKIYHTQNNRYFSPAPYSLSSNNIYRHRDKDANEITFYGVPNEGYTEYIINYMSRTVKKFIAHAQTALLKPKRVEFETQFISENGIDNRKTYLDREDFTMRENQAFSTIKNNLDSQGRNDQPTAPMTGLWLKIRTFFAANEKQKINDTTVVIRTGQRNVENP